MQNKPTIQTKLWPPRRKQSFRSALLRRLLGKHIASDFVRPIPQVWAGDK